MRAFAVVFSGLLLAAPVAAQPTGDANAAAASEAATTNSIEEEPEEDLDRRVCRRIETNTGSRVPHRLVCMTARQWRAHDRQR
jgi:hypothetical protein